MLDWEMSTLGDPLMDLGRLSATGSMPMTRRVARPGLRPDDAARQPEPRAVVERYTARSGLQSAPVFYYVYGLFKIAVIVQQIYRATGRGSQGRAVRAAHRVVRAASHMAGRAIEHGRISRLRGAE